MRSIKSFEAELSTVNEFNFDNIALSLFRLQAEQNPVYHKYLTYLGVTPQSVTRVEAIPFLPISFFKEQDVVTGEWKEESVFLSSATSGLGQSRHKVKSVEAYLNNVTHIFSQFYGPLTDYHFFALLPSYLERDGSSLIEMVRHFIELSKSNFSAFYLHNRGDLVKNIEMAKATRKKVLLLGVSFALLDLAEEVELDLSNCMVMETGGMKGRREEITREELHAFLGSRFSIPTVHSEYGMTELFSQAYSLGKGYFQTPKGMKLVIRDINDPFSTLKAGKTGGINIIDLSNIYTCAFVETQDLGRIRQDGSFEVLGRIDNSDMRGCNLLVG